MQHRGEGKGRSATEVIGLAIMSSVRTTDYGRASLITSIAVFGVGMLVGAAYFILLRLSVITWASPGEANFIYHVDGYEIGLFTYTILIAPLGYIAGILFGWVSYSRHRRKNLSANAGLVTSTALFALQVMLALIVFGAAAFLVVFDAVMDTLSHPH